MKKAVLVTLFSAATSFASFAAEEVIIASGNTTASHVVDEFSGKVETCGLYIGSTTRKSAWMLAINNGTGGTLIGKAGSYDASGYMMKIDDGEVYEKGRKSKGGNQVFGNLTDAMLSELSKGKKIVVRAFPENQYADTMTSTYDLAGSAKTVQAYKNCVAGL